MITGSLRNQVDHIWDAFWAGSISNSMTVIEQFTYLGSDPHQGVT
ncbi:hypothetical protein [Corynebacterium comes]|uniref:Uncharacterized protein n=1 Tax=Corynebacterium comes TaxID=2675218 RepID=A0A6B8W1F5_9CORY|nr:hypothetical protein [Corynebacterium comes]QGU03460.1 hypothetical protein CETAM_00835 [Corynebacterium comes]